MYLLVKELNISGRDSIYAFKLVLRINSNNFAEHHLPNLITDMRWGFSTVGIKLLHSLLVSSVSLNDTNN
jgi:hypothetical protein